MNQDLRISISDCHFVELGKIGRPHGIRGEVRLYLHNPSSSLIYSLKTVLLSLSDSKDAQKYSIRFVKDAAKFHILSLKGIQGREKAQQLNGMAVWVHRDALPALDAGEFYVADLMGLAVSCDGQSIGTIIESREQGGIEVITVANDVREIQIPVVDEYVVEKDISRGYFEVRNIEDLPVHEFQQKKR